MDDRQALIDEENEERLETGAPPIPGGSAEVRSHGGAVAAALGAAVVAVLLVEFCVLDLVGAGSGCFFGFDLRHPHGATEFRDPHVGIEFGYFHSVGMALDGSRGGEQTDMARAGDVADCFHRGADHSEHPPVGE